MKSVEEIQKKLDYEKKIQAEFENSKIDSLENQRWIVANNLVNVLEWVLKD